MFSNTLDFEAGKVYCVNLREGEEKNSGKRLVRYHGPEKPWEDICSGERTPISPEAISEAIEVPPTVVDAIKLAQDKRPIPDALPVNVYDGDDPDPWEVDIYCDDWDD